MSTVGEKKLDLAAFTSKKGAVDSLSSVVQLANRLESQSKVGTEFKLSQVHFFSEGSVEKH